MQLANAVVPNTSFYVPLEIVYRPLGGVTTPPIVRTVLTSTSVVRAYSRGEAWTAWSTLNWSHQGTKWSMLKQRPVTRNYAKLQMKGWARLEMYTENNLLQQTRIICIYFDVFRELACDVYRYDDSVTSKLIRNNLNRHYVFYFRQIFLKREITFQRRANGNCSTKGEWWKRNICVYRMYLHRT